MPDRIITSPYARARQTACAVWKRAANLDGLTVVVTHEFVTARYWNSLQALTQERLNDISLKTSAVRIA